MKSGYIFAKFNPQETTPVRTTDIFLCPESINSINPTLQTLLICVLSMSEYLTVKSMRITFQRFCLKFCKPTIMDKSLGTLLRFWGVFQFTQVQLLSSPHKQCWTRVSRTFSEFQLCIGWGEGKLEENFENDALFLDGTEKRQKNMNITLLSQGFLSRIVWILVLGGGGSLFSSFFLRFLGILETSRWSYAIIMTFETIFST